MIEEHLKIKAQPHDCKLETFVIPILLWSDSTLLASFGNASLWPIYLFLGNLTKYTHCKLSLFLAHHITYIPKVSLLLAFRMLMLISLQLGDKFQDLYQKTFGKPTSAAILHFCRREVVQEIIALKDLMDKYINGLITQWVDGRV